MSSPENAHFSTTVPTPVLPPFPAGDFPQSGLVSLDGGWGYAQPVPADFPRVETLATAYLQVPGEVVMQGLPYRSEDDFALERMVDVPASWSGCAVRVRFDAVYSHCEVFVNGEKAGDHMGGFTAFDIDVSAFVSAGTQARISLRIRNNSIADEISWGTVYAGHALAGIPRKVRLYALPKQHLTALAVATLFPDADYANAVLHVQIGASSPSPSILTLIAPDGLEIPLGTHDLNGETTIDLTVANPLLWDTEHPNLYLLKIEIGGLEYRQSVGFREISVRNRQTHLNGRRIFLRGINHHEIHPITGRADTARLAWQDVELMRAAHLNILRTSHYPPTPELAEACDRAGMLLEVEAPVCFAFGTFGKNPVWDARPLEEQAAAHDYVLRSSAEMVVMFRSHPSVVIWSVANESLWCPPFDAAVELIRSLDPTRPMTFNWAKHDDHCKDKVEIANEHYPKSGDVDTYDRETRPILFGEFSHLYCYNDRELLTDPGLRSLWSGYLDRQWQEILNLENGAGGSIWACIDDVFLIPGKDGTRVPEGYGSWGPIDGWRRRKPEYEGMRRVFDPVQIRQRQVEAGSSVRIAVENRWDATDFAEGLIHWSYGGRSGSLQLALAPNQTGHIDLPIVPIEAGLLTLTFSWPHLHYHRDHKVQVVEPEVVPLMPAAVAAIATGDGWRIGSWHVRRAGSNLALIHGAKGAETTLKPAMFPRDHDDRKLPFVTLPSDPIENACAGWAVSAVELVAGALVITGSDAAAAGTLTLTGFEDDTLRVAYDLTLKRDFELWQTGLAFRLPRDHDALRWKRDNVVDEYSPDHPARVEGVTRAFRSNVWPRTGPDEAPSWPWSMDETPEGTNDFRSTKYDILEASLSNPAGQGLRILSDGNQHVRACVQGEHVCLNVFDDCGVGSERFLTSFNPTVDLASGDRIAGVVRLGSTIGSPVTSALSGKPGNR